MSDFSHNPKGKKEFNREKADKRSGSENENTPMGRANPDCP